MQELTSVRAGGARKLVMGGSGAILMGFFLYWIRLQGYAPNGPAMITLGIPGALGLVGLIECSTGVPFSEWSARWDGLKGWQRGVLGLGVAALALAVMVGSIAFFLGE